MDRSPGELPTKSYESAEKLPRSMMVVRTGKRMAVHEQREYAARTKCRMDCVVCSSAGLRANPIAMEMRQDV